MKFYTNMEQSEKLAEILPIESADMYYDRATKIPYYSLSGSIPKDWSIPAWSLGALFNILPAVEIIKQTNEDSLGGYHIEYTTRNKYLYTERFDNPVDACIEMIIKLHDCKLLQL